MRPPVRNLLLVAMVIEAACTAAAATHRRHRFRHRFGMAPRRGRLALLAGAVGLRNSAVRRVGVPDMSTTVLTTTF